MRHLGRVYAALFVTPGMFRCSSAHSLITGITADWLFPGTHWSDGATEDMAGTTVVSSVGIVLCAPLLLIPSLVLLSWVREFHPPFVKGTVSISDFHFFPFLCDVVFGFWENIRL